jgi:O-antigen/teichoic acid export membrane protein
MPVVAVNMVLATVVFAADKEKRWMTLMLVATALDVALNFMFIPLADATWGNGAIASAVITVSTELFICAVGLRLIPSGILDRQALSNSVRCLVTSVAMLAVVLPLRDTMIVQPVAAGAVAYLVAAFMTGAIRFRDIKALHTFVSRRSVTSPVATESAAAAPIRVRL